MSAPTVPAKSANTIEGKRELTIRICDITTADVIAQQVLELREQAAKITSIHIDTTTYFQALEEQEEIDQNYTRPTADWHIDPTAASLCRPLITILTTILNTPAGGGLTTFSWPAADHTDRKFTRPTSFWVTLYAHNFTLKTLHLDFFCHEVHTLPPYPSRALFTELKTLRLDTSSAHGDDGSVVDAILRACPNLEELHFEWPPCDLDSCQIKNTSWGWTTPKLRHLNVFGWNFAPAAYTDFLVRHPGVLSLSERVDGPYEEEGTENAEMQLPTTALPSLKTLRKEFTNTHRLCDYFDSAANRPISTLAIHVRSSQGVEQELSSITESTTAQTNLCTLEFFGGISTWRPEEIDGSSSDDEDESAQERKHRKAQEDRDRETRLLTRLPHILRTVLPSLTNLEKLSIEMDSSNGYWDFSSKVDIYPDPMNEDDLLNTLALLPKSTDGKLQTLRLSDSRAKPLKEAVKRLSEGEVATGSLQVLEWCGEESGVVVLPVERRGG